MSNSVVGLRTFTMKTKSILFFIRFQLILLLFPLLIVGVCSLSKEMLGGLLIISGNTEAFFISLFAFASSGLALRMILQVFEHAAQRFGIDFSPPHWFYDWCFVLATAPPLALMTRIYIASDYEGLLGTVMGFVAAIAADYVLASSSLLLFPLRLEYTFRTPEVILRKAVPSKSNPASRLFRRWFPWLRLLGPGYVTEDGSPYPDQIIVALTAVLILYIYIATVYLGWWRLSRGGRGTGFPPLVYIQLLVLATASALSSIAFFLDRYKIPVLLVLLIYLLSSSLLFGHDHYWTAYPPDSRKNICFSDGVESWLKKYNSANTLNRVLHVGAKPIIVVVSASGGGIEASAWTAIVLTGLERKFGAAFARSVRLISSTSGGSVGALCFIQSYYPTHDAPDITQLSRIVTAAETPSLDALGWGLVADFAQFAMPAFSPLGLIPPREERNKLDRDFALEQAWRVALGGLSSPARATADPARATADPARATADPARVPVDPRLSEWRQAVNDGWLPGIVFNASIVETGEPLLFSTIALPDQQDRKITMFGASRSDLGADISMVTAARLSATFPYVSAIARGRYASQTALAAAPVNGFHVADGGYYDNDGFTIAAEWAANIARRYGTTRIAKVVIVKIDASPEPPPHAPLKGGLATQLLGPVITIYNASAATQVSRDAVESQILKSINLALGAKASGECSDFITMIPFRAHHRGPLSWALSRRDVLALDCDWSSKETQQQVNLIGHCLNPQISSLNSPPPNSEPPP
jgi:hypothetical protein